GAPMPTKYHTSSKTFVPDDSVLFTEPPTIPPEQQADLLPVRASKADVGLSARVKEAGQPPTRPLERLHQKATGDSSEKTDYLYLFERDGEIWRLRFKEKHGTLRNSKGLQCVARLLEKPNQDMESLDLEGVDARRIPRQQTDDDVLTEETKAEY